jgi:hypothetical protein
MQSIQNRPRRRGRTRYAPKGVTIDRAGRAIQISLTHRAGLFCILNQQCEESCGEETCDALSEAPLGCKKQALFRLYRSPNQPLHLLLLLSDQV